VTIKTRAAVIAIATVTLVGFVGDACGSQPPVERAIAMVEDDGNFSTGLESGQALARITTVLRDDAERCAAGKAAEKGPRCDARFAAAAYAQVLAVAMLHCTAPDRADARKNLLDYLRKVEAVGQRDQPPAPPSPPRC
jgi:hypothetical protein